MTSTLRRALLAAGMTAVAALAAAPGAQAGWMTGNGLPPVWTTNPPCHNGMVWTYGTFLQGTWPPLQTNVTIYDHALVKTGYSDPVVDPPAPGTAVTMGTYTIPQKELVLPSTFALIPPEFFPIDPTTGLHRVNRLDFSATLALMFKGVQPTGTGLRMFWRSNPSQAYFLRTGTYYTVADCWVVSAAPKALSGKLQVILSGLQLSLKTDLPKLRLQYGDGYLSPLDTSLEDGNLVLVYDVDGLRLKCKPGDPIVLSGSSLQPSGC